MLKNEKIFSADKNMLPMLNDFIAKALEQFGYPPNEVVKIQLVCEEIFINIASYAYQKTDLPAERQTVAVRIETGVSKGIGKDSVTIQFRDFGQPFDPLQVAAPDITLSASERPVGGLGLFLLKKNADETRYDYVNTPSGKQNILTFTKTLK